MDTYECPIIMANITRNENATYFDILYKKEDGTAALLSETLIFLDKIKFVKTGKPKIIFNRSKSLFKSNIEGIIIPEDIMFKNEMNK